MQKIVPESKAQKLLLACKKGNYRAKSEVYKLYAPKLLSICMRYSKDKKEAEDILHEAFIKIYTKIDQARNGTFEAWMKQVVRNEALQFIRKRVSLNIRHEQYEQDYITDYNSEDISFNTIPAKVILKLIQELPDGYRLIINLYIFDEYNHREIADILGISEGTSKSQYSRAKKKLQKQILDYNNIKNTYL